MLYFVYLEDIDNNSHIRESLVKAHMAYIGQHLERIRLAGPLMRPDGRRQAGGVLLMEADSEAEVREIIQDDPYCQAGLWPEVRVHAFREIINAWKPADGDV